MNKAAFLDRDGVLIRKAPEDQYVTRWEDFKVLPGASEAVGLFNDAGLIVVVISNQRCVGKGLVTAAEVEALHARMRIVFRTGGARIDDIYYCPHDAEPLCSCRKPKPGMLLEAARVYDIDLQNSWMIGDSESDMQAGHAAGCKTLRLIDAEVADSGTADLRATSLLDATREILTLEAKPRMIPRTKVTIVPLSRKDKASKPKDAELLQRVELHRVKTASLFWKLQ
jgi:D-glycero-D-manno-heptose 1,7-bisphosphate phosphatase